jgi:hypothetical protein
LRLANSIIIHANEINLAFVHDIKKPTTPIFEDSSRTCLQQWLTHLLQLSINLTKSIPLLELTVTTMAFKSIVSRHQLVAEERGLKKRYDLSSMNKGYGVNPKCRSLTFFGLELTRCRTSILQLIFVRLSLLVVSTSTRCRTAATVASGRGQCHPLAPPFTPLSRRYESVLQNTHHFPLSPPLRRLPPAPSQQPANPHRTMLPLRTNSTALTSPSSQNQSHRPHTITPDPETSTKLFV